MLSIMSQIQTAVARADLPASKESISFFDMEVPVEPRCKMMMKRIPAAMRELNVAVLWPR
jgi:hypothetical protein